WFIAIWATVLPWLAYSAWGSSPLPAVLPLVGAGWLMFTALEYTAHRFLFHWTPKSDWMAQVVFIIHGNHHVQPTDKLRSLMPPIISFPIVLAVSSLLNAVFGPAGAWMLFGFVLGYVAYDLTHYASHQWPMRGWLGQKLKRHHMLHHFVSEEGNYAVTGLFWDRVFGTKVTVAKRPIHKDVAKESLEPAE
ncbi:MAG: sterol desaturase family protein, partial [Pseudomonadota bacterium]